MPPATSTAVNHKREQLLWLSAAVIFAVADPVLSYREGRHNSWDWSWFAPYLMLLALVGCGRLLLLMIRAVRARRHVKRSVAAFGLALFLPIASVGTNPNMFQRGFNDYVKGVLTPDEWRSIAGLVQANMAPGERLRGPSQFPHERDQRPELWAKLAANTKIEKLEPEMTVSVHKNSTTFGWGSALVGHRGVVVYNGKGPPAESDVQSGKGFWATSIAEDISTFITSD